jgi:DNA repair exonuclease SbcCD ATPase subunit
MSKGMKKEKVKRNKRRQKMKAKLILSVFVILLTGFLMNVSSQPYRGYLMDKLNLTDKQLSEIEKLRDNHLKQMSDYRNELQKLSIDLRTEWKKANPDRKKIESITNQMSEIRNKMQKARLNHWFDVYNQLDDKQKEIFRDFRSEFFKDGRFWGPRFRKGFDRGFPRYGRGLGPCCMGFGPWWNK